MTRCDAHSAEEGDSVRRQVGLEAMRRHIEQLIADVASDEVSIYPVKRLDQAQILRAEESGEVLELRLPAIRSARSYATALHEFGHLKGRYQNSRCTMVRERAARRWARQNALIWSDAMEREATKSLAWYEGYSRFSAL